MPAEHALLFTSYRKHQSSRMQAVDIDGICHLHRIKTAQAHAATLCHGITENEFGIFHLDFASEFKFVLRGIQDRLGDAHGIVPVQAHFFLDLILHFDAFSYLERDSLFAELCQRFKAFGASGQRQVFGTGLFGLQLDLGQVFAGNTHVFKQACTFRHQGVDFFFAFVILFVKEFAFLVGRFTVLPAGSNSHVAFFASFFQISLGAVQCGTLLHGIDIGILLGVRKRCQCSERGN